MCRFIAYFGTQPLLLDELLRKPDNSLIQQSHQAKESSHGLNADGFGVAWYDLTIDTEPGIFKSIQPAWNDTNLMHISRKIQSSCFLGHVRASTVGDVNQNNCHPFAFKEYCLVHNGTIRNFNSLKRQLLQQLDDDLFLSIKGNTDSECLFFLIMQFMRKTDGNLLRAVKSAINWVVQAQSDLDAENFSKINIVITDGKEMISARFASKDQEPLSLYYSGDISSEAQTPFIVSSESLDGHKTQWHELPNNSYIHLHGANKMYIGAL